jgi:hypothetical protein
LAVRRIYTVACGWPAQQSSSGCSIDLAVKNAVNKGRRRNHLLYKGCRDNSGTGEGVTAGLLATGMPIWSPAVVGNANDNVLARMWAGMGVSRSSEPSNACWDVALKSQRQNRTRICIFSPNAAVSRTARWGVAVVTSTFRTEATTTGRVGVLSWPRCLAISPAPSGSPAVTARRGGADQQIHQPTRRPDVEFRRREGLITGGATSSPVPCNCPRGHWCTRSIGCLGLESCRAPRGYRQAM